MLSGMSLSGVGANSFRTSGGPSPLALEAGIIAAANDMIEFS